MASQTFTLSARCDRQAADALLSDLRAGVTAGDVVIDGSAVSQFGQAMLQLLLSARRTAMARGNSFTIIASDAMQSTLAMVGAEHLLDQGARP